MGEESAIRFVDTKGGAWVGEQDEGAVALAAVLQGLAELDPDECEYPEAWRKVLPDSAHLVRLLGQRTAHIHVRGCEVNEIAVKLALPGWEQRHMPRFIENVRHSKARRAYLWAQRIRSIGIDVPRPLAFLEREEHPAHERSLLVTAYTHASKLLYLRDDLIPFLDPNQKALLEKRVFGAVARNAPRDGAFV